jgi:hypothetical protein
MIKKQKYKNFILADLEESWWQELIYFPLYRFFYYKPSLLLSKVRYFLQRVFRGYADCDLWNLDLTMSQFIYPRLKAFRDKYAKDSSYEKPKVLTAEEFSVLPKDKWGNYLIEAYSSQEWLEILDKMLLAFERVNKQFDYKDPSNGTEEERLRIEEGLQLFAKHFQQLWD